MQFIFNSQCYTTVIHNTFWLSSLTANSEYPFGGGVRAGRCDFHSIRLLLQSRLRLRAGGIYPRSSIFLPGDSGNLQETLGLDLCSGPCFLQDIAPQILQTAGARASWLRVGTAPGRKRRCGSSHFAEPRGPGHRAACFKVPSLRCPAVRPAGLTMAPAPSSASSANAPPPQRETRTLAYGHVKRPHSAHACSLPPGHAPATPSSSGARIGRGCGSGARRKEALFLGCSRPVGRGERSTPSSLPGSDVT